MDPRARLARIGRFVAQRVDSWANTLTGVGTATGKTNIAFAPNQSELLSLADCENLYNFDGVAARICDAVPVNALRGGFSVSTGDAEVETAIAATVDDLNVPELATRAWTWGRTYGGGALFLGIDDGLSTEEPVDEARIRALRWMVDVDRRDLYPLTWESNPGSPRFGQPDTYRLTRMGGTATETVTVHHTRVVRFEGITPTRRRRLMLQGWGESVLQRAYLELQAMRGAFAAAGVLVQEASQGVLKIKDLMDLMAADTDDTIRRRLALMDESRSVARSLLLDADGESYERVDTGALTGVADIMDRMVLLLSAVTGIPVTILMGKSPAGLNATGESDMRAWYDAVASEREKMLRSRLERVVRLLLLSREGPTRGQEPQGWRVKFPSLWQPTPSEEEDLRGKVATRDVQYIQAGVLTPEEVAVSRFRQEGWSAETTVDLDARRAAMEADDAAAAQHAAEGAPAPGTAEDPTGGAAAPGAPAVGQDDGAAEAEDGADVARGDAVPEKYAHIGFTPPKGAQEAAARALEVRAGKPESQRGMTDVGIARARDLSSGSRLSPDTVRRMLNFFTRHEGDKAGETWDEQGPGWQAWQGWGGDAGHAWARKVVAQMEAADKDEG